MCSRDGCPLPTNGLLAPVVKAFAGKAYATKVFTTEVFTTEGRNLLFFAALRPFHQHTAAVGRHNRRNAAFADNGIALNDQLIIFIGFNTLFDPIPLLVNNEHRPRNGAAFRYRR